MIRTTYYALYLFAMILPLSSNGQTYKEEKTTEEKILNQENLSMNLLSDLGFDMGMNQSRTTLTNNAVYVQQVGNSNIVDVNIDAKTSEININQQGNLNRADLDYFVNSATATINQLGDRNVIRDLITDRSANSSLNLTQEGTNLNFQRYQTNTLTESLKFKQTGQSKTLIIRSFK